MKKDWAEASLKRTVFPRAEAIPQSFAMAFMQMMMAHAKFEAEVRALQSTVANDPKYGEQPQNLWSAKKRPKLMVELIEQNLGQIPETAPIKKLLIEAGDPTDKRNHLAHGIWWAFDPETASIDVRSGIQREDKDQFGEYSKRLFWASLLGLRRSKESCTSSEERSRNGAATITTLTGRRLRLRHNLYPYRCRDIRVPARQTHACSDDLIKCEVTSRPPTTSDQITTRD